MEKEWRPCLEILVHVCCAPCFTYLHEKLEEDGHQVRGFFFNPNIHPYQESKKRLHEVQRYSSLKPVEIEYDTNYDIETFIRGALTYIDQGKKRCEYCIRTRLEETAKKAREKGIKHFTTTLLESKYQPHEIIKEIGEEIARNHGLEFYYEDFRKGWKRSIELSKELELYRQKYCGCVFSEEERYRSKKV
jgi:predicted adenine nucleotide alpha hydrolase (AANH) superfamily ATPase